MHIRRLRVVVWLGDEGVQNAAVRHGKLFIEHAVVVCRSGILLRQPQRIAQRIYFVFSFPYIRAVEVGHVVFVPMVVGFFVKGVGVRVHGNVGKLPF